MACSISVSRTGCWARCAGFIAILGSAESSGPASVLSQATPPRLPPVLARAPQDLGPNPSSHPRPASFSKVGEGAYTILQKPAPPASPPNQLLPVAQTPWPLECRQTHLPPTPEEQQLTGRESGPSPEDWWRVGTEKTPELGKALKPRENPKAEAGRPTRHWGRGWLLKLNPDMLWRLTRPQDKIHRHLRTSPSYSPRTPLPAFYREPFLSPLPDSSLSYQLLLVRYCFLECKLPTSALVPRTNKFVEGDPGPTQAELGASAVFPPPLAALWQL